MMVVAKEASGSPMLKELDLAPLTAEHLKEPLVVSVVLAVPLTVDHLKAHLVALVALAVLVVPIAHALTEFVAPCHQNQ